MRHNLKLLVSLYDSFRCCYCPSNTLPHCPGRGAPGCNGVQRGAPGVAPVKFLLIFPTPVRQVVIQVLLILVVLLNAIGMFIVQMQIYLFYENHFCKEVPMYKSVSQVWVSMVDFL